MKKGDVMPNGFVLGMGRTPLNLTEAQIRYAMKNSKSNSGAARFLNVSLGTYEKYSKQYKDETTGKTLWEIQKNQRGVGVPKAYNVKKGIYNLFDILDGKYPNYSVTLLKKRLINNERHPDLNFPHECHVCGYNEKRITDGQIPLILDHINDDWTDHHRDNIRFICYNCFFNMRGNIRGSQPAWRMEEISKAKETVAKNKKELENKQNKEK